MLKNVPIRIFEQLVQGDRLSSIDHDLLLNESRKNNCFGWLSLNDPKLNLSLKVIHEIIDQRSQLLRLVYPKILETLALHNVQIDPPSATLPLLWHYWMPLARVRPQYNTIIRQQQETHTD